ncbi:hypothetical protein [Zhaonella formicivorans]|uniref:hypothetical protein n=1 Tax=Zhaonella formicivorans TaxID=2528593 RepID=UPI0010E87F94|nr:hypothetical protein [Zhaonella formicivorans]
MAIRTRGLITSGDKKYKKLGSTTKAADFEAGTELSIERQLPEYARSNMRTERTVYTSPRPESFELYPGE